MDLLDAVLVASLFVLMVIIGAVGWVAGGPARGRRRRAEETSARDAIVAKRRAYEEAKRWNPQHPMCRCALPTGLAAGDLSLPDYPLATADGT